MIDTILTNPAKSITNIIPNLKINHPSLGQIKTNSYMHPQRPNWIITELKNINNDILAFESYTYPDSAKPIHGAIIDVDYEYRRKGYYLGEILRLSSIIMMVKNKVKEFMIYSKPTAIYFHSKYKFEPNIGIFKERDSVLNSIIQHGNDNMQNLRLKAQVILEQINQCADSKTQANLCTQTNMLLKKYLQEILNNRTDYQQHAFPCGIDMKLTSDSLTENKDFFNALFKKHNINYKI